MKVLRLIIDLAAIISIGLAICAAYGMIWGFVSQALVAAYGVWCFYDGSRK